MSDEAVFFASQAEWRAWLAAHHDSADEVWVGFWKVATGKPSMTWAQSVDQALCYGWIDGVRKSIDDGSYRIRFTPRRPGSVWSRVNVGRVEALTAEGLMTPAGLAAAERRTSAGYSYERKEAAFDAEQERVFRADGAAWAFWERQPPGYRRLATHWVTSAKQQATRDRRLATLIADSAAGRRLAQLTSPARRRGSPAPPR